LLQPAALIGDDEKAWYIERLWEGYVLKLNDRIREVKDFCHPERHLSITSFLISSQRKGKIGHGRSFQVVVVAVVVKRQPEVHGLHELARHARQTC
jgi:hypothetical protein